jgi:hypothetical protein
MWNKVFISLILLTPTLLMAQQTGQPASDVLQQSDIWGNPTFRGGVTNKGPTSHSIW